MAAKKKTTRKVTTAKRDATEPEKIVQLLDFRGYLYALTDQGKVYRKAGPRVWEQVDSPNLKGAV
tara:strand:- start:1047 stop:1241 length:195 start_codon:yes stop_codon:yes gene_type:complete